MTMPTSAHEPQHAGREHEREHAGRTPEMATGSEKVKESAAHA